MREPPTQPESLSQVAEAIVPGEGTLAWLRRVGFFGGPLLAVLVWFAMPEARYEGEQLVGGVTSAERGVAAVAALMCVWWLTEALPLEATALLPLALFPALGVLKTSEAARPYADPIVFLFLGGMLLGQAMERWGLHKRIALGVVGAFGARPSRLVLGFLAATAFISMWVANVTAALMMLPIGTSVVHLVREQLAREASASHIDAATAHEQGRRFATSVMLAIAYGASIGGVGTLIGTPPVTQLAGFVRRRYETTLGFGEWMLFGVPIVVLGVLIAWMLIARVANRLTLREVPGVREVIAERRHALGALRGAELTTLLLFVGAAIAWVVVPLVYGATRPELPKGGPNAPGAAPIAHDAFAWASPDRLGDAVIGIGAAILLFVIPAGRGSTGGERRAILTWREAERVPWGVLLIFGGGLVLADAIAKTGLDRFIAGGADALAGLPVPVVLLVIALAATFLSELMSNTALTAVALQVAAPMAERLGIPVFPVLAVVTLGASLAFMMPAGTPPNALVFASGHVSIRSMARTGLLLNLAFACLGTAVVVAAMQLGWLPEISR